MRCDLPSGGCYGAGDIILCRNWKPDFAGTLCLLALGILKSFLLICCETHVSILSHLLPLLSNTFYCLFVPAEKGKNCPARGRGRMQGNWEGLFRMDQSVQWKNFTSQFFRTPSFFQIEVSPLSVHFPYSTVTFLERNILFRILYKESLSTYFTLIFMF